MITLAASDDTLGREIPVNEMPTIVHVSIAGTDGIAIECKTPLSSGKLRGVLHFSSNARG